MSGAVPSSTVSPGANLDFLGYLKKIKEDLLKEMDSRMYNMCFPPLPRTPAHPYQGAQQQAAPTPRALYQQ